MSFLLLQRFFSYELSRDNNHYMLHHFLLIIFPTGFKGVLATYLHYSPHIFPTGFLEETFKMKMMNVQGKYILGGVYQDDVYSQRQALIRGSVRN